MFREYWTSFAKDGVPSSSIGPAWDPVQTEGQLGLPMLELRLEEGNPSTATAMRDRAYPGDNRAAQEMVAIACGWADLQKHADSCKINVQGPLAAPIQGSSGGSNRMFWIL